MRAVDIIAKKRDGQALNEAEIRWFVDSYTKDELPDYQAAALMMAILIRGMTPDEVTMLTLAMAAVVAVRGPDLTARERLECIRGRTQSLQKSFELSPYMRNCRL